jgi:hypothetical protein
MYGVLKKVIVPFVATVGFISAVVGTSFTIYSIQGKVSDAVILIIGGGFLLLLIYCLVIHFVWGRNRKYAQALSDINAGFAAIHHHLDEDGDGRVDRNDAYYACRTMCNFVGRAFTRITGVKCFVTVKLLYDEHDPTYRQYAHAFARDEDQPEARRTTDYDGHTNYIEDNTAFDLIFRTVRTANEGFYLRNNLRWEYAIGKYKNTSFESFGKRPNRLLCLLWDWCLPYEATLVVPIAPNHPKKRMKDGLLGFLCVDSGARRSVFKERYDVELAKGLASGLYNFLDVARKRQVELDTKLAGAG